MAVRPEVLRYKKDFDRLYKKGKSSGDRFVVVFFVASSDRPYTRRAFLASKKVGNAVVRNRARRLMKEGFRKLKDEIRPGHDVLFIARHSIVSCGCGEVEASMRSALSKGGLLK